MICLIGSANAGTGGEVIGRHIFGLATDYQSNPLLIADRPLIYKEKVHEQAFKVDEASFKITVFDHDMSSIYISKTDKNSFNLIDTESLPLGVINGLHAPSFGLETPWNTLLVGEGGLVNAREFDAFLQSFKPYFKDKSELVNPYHYGWLTEVIILNAKGKAKAIKNYATGRLFANKLLVMPDRKTYYFLDNANSGVVYIFVADAQDSLAKGSLYALELRKDVINTILLGNTSSLKMKFKLKKAEFSSIYKTRELINGKCETDYKYINTVYGEECIKLKSKSIVKYAGFFEPIRTVALKGLSSDREYIEDLSFDVSKNQLAFQTRGNGRILLSLGENVELGSQFFIQE